MAGWRDGWMACWWLGFNDRMGKMHGEGARRRVVGCELAGTMREGWSGWVGRCDCRGGGGGIAD